MAKMITLFVVCLVLFASINVSANIMDTFLVVGKVYCDTCRCGFETSASKYLPGSRVRIECKNRDTNDLAYTVEGFTNSKGEYKILVNSDRRDEFCDVVLIRSSDPMCAEPNTGRDRARVVLASNNGMVSNTRFANSMGFLSNEPLASCTKILQQYEFSEDQF
ncbi:major pollen allergen Lol p 11-like [Solanum stenotomum]|uniref:major pollen allergen Lol p 11-like n=1 Tax=Solanum stenotomum TaxID=172797 RepID=UPI0020D0598E|nr:major pollen allergen Lol p 11-like [Solanum stenotomum]